MANIGPQCAQCAHCPPGTLIVDISGGGLPACTWICQNPDGTTTQAQPFHCDPAGGSSGGLGVALGLAGLGATAYFVLDLTHHKARRQRLRAGSSGHTMRR